MFRVGFPQVIQTFFVLVFLFFIKLRELSSLLLISLTPLLKTY